MLTTINVEVEVEHDVDVTERELHEALLRDVPGMTLRSLSGANVVAVIDDVRIDDRAD